MVAFATERGLCGLEFLEPRRLDRFDARLARWFAPFSIADDPDFPVIGDGGALLSE
jgi:hypothetical protein